jgi:hypothetical protein
MQLEQQISGPKAPFAGDIQGSHESSPNSLTFGFSGQTQYLPFICSLVLSKPIYASVISKSNFQDNI